MGKHKKTSTHHSKKKKEYRYKKAKQVKQKVLLNRLILWFNIIVYTVLALIICLVVLVAGNTASQEYQWSYQFYTVRTNSMRTITEKENESRGLTKGDLIIVKKVNYETLKTNDIITFNYKEDNPASLVTHRIIETDTPILENNRYVKGVTTQGDANNVPDKPIKREQIKGKMIHCIPDFGRKIAFFKKNKGWLIGAFIFIWVCMTLLFYILRQLLNRDE